MRRCPSRSSSSSTPSTSSSSRPTASRSAQPGATSSREDSFKFGTVGKALPGWELKLAEDGELFIRSPTVFAGYYKDDEATAAILDDDGWLATGDIATIDDDGFVTITDRKKDILVTAGGKNVAPQNLENELKSSRYVSQALVVGDRRPYVAALITLDPTEIAGWAQRQGLDGDLVTLSRHPDVHALVQGIVDEVNAPHSRFEQIKRFDVLPRDFSMEEGEVTPTLKLRRKICQEHFAAEIERLYAAREFFARRSTSRRTSCRKGSRSSRRRPCAARG